MSEPVVSQISDERAQQLLEERARNFEANQQAQEAAPPPGDAPPPVSGEKKNPDPLPEEKKCDPASLLPLVQMWNMALQRIANATGNVVTHPETGQKLVPQIDDGGAMAWTHAAAPVIDKYGGEIPYLLEFMFLTTTVVVFVPPTILALRGPGKKKKGPEKPLKEAVLDAEATVTVKKESTE